MKLILILLTLSVKSNAKSLRCHGCIRVKLVECLQNCSEVVPAVDFSNSSYTNWDSLATFNNLTIRQLYLDHNKFITLEYTTIPDCLKELNTLYLDFNKIEFIPEQAFAEMTMLQDLNLSSNQISNVDPNAFKMNANLKFLNLNCNSIKHLTFLEHTKSIKELSLKDNKIEDLSIFYSYTFDMLGELNLSKNRITYIKQKFFENLPVINDVYLEHNLIHTIESPIRVERFINLSHNQLKCVNFTHVSRVNLEENTLICEFIDQNKNKFQNKFQKSENCTNQPDYKVCYPQQIESIENPRYHQYLPMIILAVIFCCIVFCSCIICIVLIVICRKIRSLESNITTNTVPPEMLRLDSPEDPVYEEIQPPAGYDLIN